MNESELTYVGPPIDDRGVLVRVPADLRDLLERTNGFIAHHGGLHVRGACLAPTWHSLGYWWQGDDAIHRQFVAVLPTDVPFAEEALGDQFLLRDGEVHRLIAESGEMQSLGMGLRGFLDATDRDPVGFLALEPLERFVRDGGTLEPGQLLSVYPPFISAESKGGVSMRAIPTAERISFLAKLARLVSQAEDGSKIRLDPKD